jgi:nitrate/TMAO reductase-like tetraheme cytochrome c subunit
LPGRRQIKQQLSRAAQSRAIPTWASAAKSFGLNCLRCHNIRPPTMYSDAQWDVILHHMRLRANITGQEQRAILEFLKSAK